MYCTSGSKAEGAIMLQLQVTSMTVHLTTTSLSRVRYSQQPTTVVEEQGKCDYGLPQKRALQQVDTMCPVEYNFSGGCLLVLLFRME